MPGSAKGWDYARAKVAEIGRASVRAGVVGPAASAQHGDGPATNGEIAIAMEYGTPMIPARPFVAQTFADPMRRAELALLQGRLIGAVMAGKMSRDQALGLLGAWAAGAIRATIRDGDFAPLAPATIAAKGSSKPLVDTGQLAGAVGFEVIT